MRYEFRWNHWNRAHIAEHGVYSEEAEEIVRGARAPYPREIGNEKVLARGRTSTGAYMQVIFLIDPDDTLYVIHARPLTDVEKRRFRRSLR